MRLQSLVLCADEKILRVLRRVLGELEIDVEHVAEAEEAIRKLTRKRFEAVIVDCHREETAAHVLRSARSALCNKRAVAVAIIDSARPVKSAFDLGAHFVLYKPISMERAKASFRAARALMKAERRHNVRVAVQIPVNLTFGGDQKQKTVTTDISEGGIAVQLARRGGNPGALQLQFTLPGTEYNIECGGEIAWENAGRQGGIRFAGLSAEDHTQIKSWLARHSPEFEEEDPPVPCKLTDLSLGGCYIELGVPFPVRTRVILSMKAAELKLQVQGIVRVAQNDVGMGVEFTQTTDMQREKVETLIRSLMSSGSATPELLVEPEGLELAEVAVQRVPQEVEDPLLDLFRTKGDLPTEEFQLELRKQRGAQPETEKSPAAV